MSSTINLAPYLQTSRLFPEEVKQLTVEINKAYVDTANAVNSRIISTFAKSKPVVTGEAWYLTTTKQQTLRQVYSFTAAGNILHGINTSKIVGFTRIYGSFTDGTVYYPLPYVAIVAADQVKVTVTSTNIVITAGGSAPSITSGVIVLEWLTQP